MRLVDALKLICPVNSNKYVCTVNFNKSLNSKIVNPVNLCVLVILVNLFVINNVCKSFFVGYWRHVILFLILLFHVVSVNTSVFNRTILHMIIFTNIHMTNLIFINLFKCAHVILVYYFLFIAGRPFEYLSLGIFVIFKHFFKGALSGLKQFLVTENHLKMMKNAFYFTSKALFVLKIFKFLSWLFGHVSKWLD